MAKLHLREKWGQTLRKAKMQRGWWLLNILAQTNLALDGNFDRVRQIVAGWVHQL